MKTELVATALFAVALLHSFSTSFVAKLSHKFPKGSFLYSVFHWLAEVEIVFGFWAIVFLIFLASADGPKAAAEFHSRLNLTESFFIFCIMLVSSTRAVVTLARRVIFAVSGAVASASRLPLVQAQFLTLMTLGPLLGSVMTEPAAITITALLLFRMIDAQKTPQSFLYVLLAFLFVNVSVGGSLTHFAAPPILMVARPWGWSLQDVFWKLGIPGLLSIVISNAALILFYRRRLNEYLLPLESDHYPIPKWISLVHAAVLFAVIYFAHHPEVFVPLTMVFIGFVHITRHFQDGLKFKESGLVAFFLYGLIVFGSLQSWWLNSLIAGLGPEALYFGAIGLTAVTDNAALTYLGSQITGLGEISKWALTAGALVGGGLTILANAPNAAGFSVLSPKFQDGSLNAFKLFKAALFPTAVAMACYYVRLLF